MTIRIESPLLRHSEALSFVRNRKAGRIWENAPRQVVRSATAV